MSKVNTLTADTLKIGYIEPISVQQLMSLQFLIPSYQRGYRWSTQQVRDLIEDIEEFCNKIKELHDKGVEGIYCLQPLVVKKNGQNWDVIDGQQRLTTINIILSCFKQPNFVIRYETREKSQQFLEHILEKSEEDAIENIDFYHMIKARDLILRWKESKEEMNDSLLQNFIKVLLTKVKFIWYDTDTQNPIAVFTRLNMDKIPLTSAELIKAILLNRSNFDKNEGYEKVRLYQHELAVQWDKIESMLQNDEFWLFFHDDNQAPETRIDYIFEMICNQKMLGEPSQDIGTDQSYVFRYFYNYFHQYKNNHEVLHIVWNMVMKIYNTLYEWFTNFELYHYIGYLMARPKESTRQKGNHKSQQNLLYSLIQKWNEPNMTIGKFKQYLLDQINNTLNECRDLNMEYETSGHPKTQCRPLLLIYNIETIIQQGLIFHSDYKQDFHNKFPFNLYKKEKWDVEHIDSNTENDLTDFDSQKEWLLTIFILAKEKQKQMIKDFCIYMEDKGEDERKKEFETISNTILSQANEEDKLKEEEKNMIWNFTLLDESTNRSYRNAIFSAKRRIIIGKEQGVFYPLPKVTKERGFEQPKETKAKSAFIPPCTKQAFMKYYSPTSGNMVIWTKSDAEAYRQNIYRILSEKFNITK